MDLSTTIYDSTQHDNFYPAASADHGLSVSELTAFINDLMATLVLEELGSIYFNHLQVLLPIEGLSLSDFDARWVYGRASLTSVPLELPVNNVASLDEQAHNAYYYLTQTLTMSQRTILVQLHDMFTKQLGHALAYRQLHKMATKDMLTGLGNRSAFDEALTRQLGWAQRHHEPFALLVIDLDNFKTVNDTWGHREGDNVLVTIASQLKGLLRDEDEAFRFGGDELCCLLDCQSQQQLACAAARIQHNLKQSDYLNKRHITCSLGGTIYRANDDAGSLFDRADKALYKVKNSGKCGYHAA
ncbi:diguanylate cyclase [Alteromonas sp. 345S023]|uniref:diguanylate cyclase n=1 Tax=Alteromonas profundi TaxID=2696062 RepID=A0A7X5RJY2_9ALTE|nr:diguanylate cyclase [Alteromonas profundi]